MKERNRVILFSLFICVLIVIIVILSIFLHTGSVSGVTENVEKYEINSKYYIVINNVVIRVSQVQYQTIQSEIGIWYNYEYSYNSLTNIAKLKEINEIYP